MDVKQVAEILFFVVIAVVIVIAVFNLLKKKTENQNQNEAIADNIVDFLMDNLKSKIIPYIMKIAMEEDLQGCINYADFMDKCKTDFVDKLYEILESASANTVVQIPEQFKAFLSKDIISKVMDKAFDLEEVDMFIYDLYMQMVEARAIEAERIEAETAKLNAEIGVEDDETLVKENLGIANPPDDGMVDIGGELSALDESEMIEPIDLDE